MNRQGVFTDFEYASRKRSTRREEFLKTIFAGETRLSKEIIRRSVVAAGNPRLHAARRQYRRCCDHPCSQFHEEREWS